MKYSSEAYSRALTTLLRENKDDSSMINKIVSNFVRLLHKNGDIKKARNILGRIEKTLIKEAGGKLVDLVVPREIPDALFSKIKKTFGAKDQIRVILDPKIVAGAKIIINEEKIVDNSLSGALKRMFI